MAVRRLEIGLQGLWSATFDGGSGSGFFSDKSSELDKMASSDEADLSVASFRHDSSMGRYHRILQCGCGIQDDDEGLGDDNGPWRRRR